MPTNLSPAQLAEGARLLAAEQAAVYDRTEWPMECSKLIDWFWEHRVALLAAAQRTAEMDGCVREIARKMSANSHTWKTHAATSMTRHGRDAFAIRAEDFDDAAEQVRAIASRHNIDLSEPTPAGEAKGGER